MNYMLWLEPNPNNEPAKTLADALRYFAAKYGVQPTCVLAPLTWPEGTPIPEGLTLERVRHVRPGYLMIGSAQLGTSHQKEAGSHEQPDQDGSRIQQETDAD